MLFVTILLLCTSALASVVPRRIYSEDPHDLKRYFEEFIVTYGKQYADEAEKNKRFQIFKENIAKFNKKNADPEETAIFGIDPFTDLTTEEFLQKYTGFDVDAKLPEVTYVNITRQINVPDTFDWRQKNVVSRVKHQGNCGSCWAFATTGTTESSYAIRHGGSPPELSEQQLVDCDPTGNCDKGGTAHGAIQYIINAGGIEGESDYPYIDGDGQCSFDSSKVRVKVTTMLPFDLANAEVTKQHLVNHGPIAIALAAESWHGYQGDILWNCVGSIKHAVLLVGYGRENDQDFWIIKNSWGTGWGRNGYIRVGYRGGDNPCQMYNSYARGVQVV